MTLSATTNIYTLSLHDALPILVFDGATADANKTTFVITDPTAAQTVTFRNASGTVANSTGMNSSHSISSFTVLTSNNKTTLGTGASLTNTFGRGTTPTNTIGVA